MTVITTSYSIYSMRWQHATFPFQGFLKCCLASHHNQSIAKSDKREEYWARSMLWRRRSHFLGTACIGLLGITPPLRSFHINFSNTFKTMSSSYKRFSKIAGDGEVFDQKEITRIVEKLLPVEEVVDVMVFGIGDPHIVPKSSFTCVVKLQSDWLKQAVAIVCL